MSYPPLAFQTHIREIATKFNLKQKYKRLVIRNYNKDEEYNNWYAANTISILAISRKRDAM